MKKETLLAPLLTCVPKNVLGLKNAIVHEEINILQLLDGAKLCLVLFDTAVLQCDTQQKLDVDSGRKRRRRKATDFWKPFTTFQTQELSQEPSENLFRHRNLNPECVFFPKTSLVRLQHLPKVQKDDGGGCRAEHFGMAEYTLYIFSHTLQQQAM